MASPARNLISAGLLAGLILPQVPARAEEGMDWIGVLPGAVNFNSHANGISADGSVVVGDADGPNGTEAFSWTMSGGLVGLGYLPGGSTQSLANGASANGSVIVGETNSSNGYQAFRWTQANGMVGLGYLPGGGFSRATSVNANGLVIVGESSSSNGSQEAFRWTLSGGMVGLGDLPGGTFHSIARGVSGDGKVVVGESTSGIGWEAFRWTQADGMLGLSAGTNSSALAVNTDGSVIVGETGANGGTEAFRWTQANGVAGMGFLSGDVSSSAWGINPSGSVVVGISVSPSNIWRAFRWTQSGGMQSVQDWLAGGGVTVTGWTLQDATGVSADGSIVVGSGIDASGHIDGYIARIGSGLIGMNEISNSLANVNEISSAGGALSSLSLHGAHHQLLLDMAMPDGKGNCFWTGGDWGRYNQFDANASLAEVGFCHDFLPGKLRAGIGVGKSYVRQDLAESGHANLDGGYLVAEADYRLVEPLTASFTGFYGDWDARISRGYMNAGSLDASKGNTNVTSAAVRARIDWNDAFHLGEVTITPRGEFTLTRVSVDEYTENGGGFPATFNNQNQTTRELRLSMNGEKPLTETTQLRGTLEAVHRFDSNSAILSGNVIGLFAFSIPGNKIQQNWQRIGLELDHQFTPTSELSVSFNAANQGEDPDFSGAIRLNMVF